MNKNMKSIECKKCGSNDFTILNGYRKCNYCGTIYQITKEDISIKESNISINSDVQRLLQKCKTDPVNAKKYANLILDIEPNNREALKYL